MLRRGAPSIRKTTGSRGNPGARVVGADGSSGRRENPLLPSNGRVHDNVMIQTGLYTLYTHQSVDNRLSAASSPRDKSEMSISDLPCASATASFGLPGSSTPVPERGQRHDRCGQARWRGRRAGSEERVSRSGGGRVLHSCGQRRCAGERCGGSPRRTSPLRPAACATVWRWWRGPRFSTSRRTTSGPISLGSRTRRTATWTRRTRCAIGSGPTSCISSSPEINRGALPSAPALTARRTGTGAPAPSRTSWGTTWACLTTGIRCTTTRAR